MPRDARIDKLHGLAKELYAIAESLDDSGVACDGCGSYRRHNFEEYVLRQKVEGAVVSLSNLAEAFSRLDKRRVIAIHTIGEDA